MPNVGKLTYEGIRNTGSGEPTICHSDTDVELVTFSPQEKTSGRAEKEEGRGEKGSNLVRKKAFLRRESKKEEKRRNFVVSPSPRAIVTCNSLTNGKKHSKIEQNASYIEGVFI